jgi:choline dehydrogenase-like flavoprotein
MSLLHNLRSLLGVFILAPYLASPTAFASLGPDPAFQSAHSTTTNASIVYSTPPFANLTSFDYVVLGGGTAGLALSRRLAARSPALRVLTLEAGMDDRADPEIYSLLEFSAVFGTARDWAWDAEDGRVINGGKTLGGSSSINGAAWTRGVDAQYDAWGELLGDEEGGVGWQWAGEKGMYAYMRKVRRVLRFSCSLLLPFLHDCLPSLKLSVPRPRSNARPQMGSTPRSTPRRTASRDLYRPRSQMRRSWRVRRLA